MARWYARKDNDQQYQIKAGAELERLGGDREGRSITIGEYMELRVAYKQVHRTVIENKSEYKQNHFHEYSIITTPDNLDDEAEKKYDSMNPPTKNRFFVFILQHYRERVQNIFLRAGATVGEYNQAV
eukprot:499629-Amphidinium_carterae.1